MIKDLTQESVERQSSVFVVEDEGLISMELADRLTSLGYQVRGSAARGEEALELIRRDQPDLVLMDIKLAGKLTGIETAAKLRESEDVAVIYLTAYCDDELLREAAHTEPYGYLLKPFDERELHATIKMALNKRRAERDLRQTELMFRSALDLWNDAVAILTADGRVLTSNSAFSKSFGGGRVTETMVAQSRADMEVAVAQAAAGTAGTVELELSGSEGEARRVVARLQALEEPARVRGRGRHILFVCRDHDGDSQTGRGNNRAGAIPFEVEISHHLNNLLNIIVGNAELAEQHLPKPPSGHPAESSAASILDAASDAGILIQRLLESSGRAPVGSQVIHLAEVLDQAVTEVEPLLLGKVELEREIDPDCPQVSGDPEQLRRVVIELLANAWRALPNGAGRIRMQLREARDLSSLPQARPGQRYAALSVADDGAGIDDATRARIFEPFFTTHPKGTVFCGDVIGQGAGLGLAVVRGIINAHGGGVTVRSQRGQGADFTVLLPIEDGATKE